MYLAYRRPLFRFAHNRATPSLFALDLAITADLAAAGFIVVWQQGWSRDTRQSYL